jgi:hypothetical protein
MQSEHGADRGSVHLDVDSGPLQEQIIAIIAAIAPYLRIIGILSQSMLLEIYSATLPITPIPLDNRPDHCGTVKTYQVQSGR